jgi:hypothetical protein
VISAQRASGTGEKIAILWLLLLALLQIGQLWSRTSWWKSNRYRHVRFDLRVLPFGDSDLSKVPIGEQFDPIDVAAIVRVDKIGHVLFSEAETIVPRRRYGPPG